MKLQVVSGLKRVKNETTSWFQFQTTENEAKSCFLTSNESGMKLKVISNFNLPIMKLQVVYGLKRVKNETTSWFHFETTEDEATSCFQLQMSLE